MPLTAGGQRGLSVLAIIWVVVGIVAGFRGAWDVVTAMVLSYCLGGVMADVEWAKPSADEPPEGEL